MNRSCSYCEGYAYVTKMDPKTWKPIHLCAVCIVKDDKEDSYRVKQHHEEDSLPSCGDTFKPRLDKLQVQL